MANFDSMTDSINDDIPLTLTVQLHLPPALDTWDRQMFLAEYASMGDDVNGTFFVTCLELMRLGTMFHIAQGSKGSLLLWGTVFSPPWNFADPLDVEMQYDLQAIAIFVRTLFRLDWCSSNCIITIGFGFGRSWIVGLIVSMVLPPDYREIVPGVGVKFFELPIDLNYV